MSRLPPEQHRALADQALRDGFVVLRDHFSVAKLDHWNQVFLPLLDQHIAREGHLRNRGPNRFYVTLPFLTPFADPAFLEDDDVLAIVTLLAGEDPVLCQLATDTPLKGSDYQDLHRDTPPLFPEWGRETPPFQLAVNFPLVDVTPEIGPVEIARGTHMMSRDEGLKSVEMNRTPLESIPMRRGDVMIRDVRGIHRGTPNRTDTPRPMVVIGYSRKWLHRPEVSIDVPRAEWDRLSDRLKHLMRFNRIVDGVELAAPPEAYQSFAY
jgi:ectoine hydroxylase-related dioxygenase (phytanoyl-CoA dioxygenase family)